MNNVLELNRLGKDPIRAGQPAGSDAKYDAAYDTLQSEVEKAVSRIHGAADWEKIVALASDLLATKSKDFVIAGYLAVALIQTQKANGFETGSAIISDLVEHFWEDGFPSKLRMRGRSRAIAWWIEKATESLKRPEFGVMPAEPAELLCERFEKLANFLRAEMEDAPSFSKLITATRIAAERQALPETDNTVRSSTKSAAIPSEMDMRRETNALSERLRQMSAQFLLRDAALPIVYRLRRQSLWIGIDELPPATEARTGLPAPDSRSIDRLKTLHRQSNYAALLEAVEEESFRFIFWLDLQRYAAEALVAMGDRFQKASDTVHRETATFLSRLPGLEELTFSDGMPLADAETQQWIKTLRSSH